MASSGLRKTCYATQNWYLPQMGTIGYLKRSTWYQDEEARNWWCCRIPYLPIFDVAGTLCGPLCYYRAHVVGLAQWPWLPHEGGLFEVEVSIVEQDLIPNVGQLVLANVHVEGWIIDPYDGPSNGMWLSLPTMEQLSNLVWWPEVLA